MINCPEETWVPAWVSLFAAMNTALLVFNQWDRRRSLKRIERKVNEANNHSAVEPEC